ncbi:addiction module antidote protein, HigA family [Stenotrophomonas maltophilia]|uniref:HigA family addiction module antitoxin n=1 Tax=Stenotrophomonas maltophilia group TaxID=995085 RepID=UPI000D4C5491|nr:MULTISPECIES: HigA family addiction module antitoxin [Stenotrophomonas maltophilia group]MCF3498497.1 HigA family addiction module antidote protein [Stenotrophomonas maltophilia]MDQ4682106.1 HigA family addiction module antitoxin [Stenotrophomonas maltophilia group sp. RNC7]PSD16313.1 addiction module antidote protein, HigA family [Stenotrophomonas maltophilia]PZT08813.1 addiction module antidote protein, HigA family [Stenotrophomonas maltophilia]UGB20811.1 HigA family addiction module anti
MTRANAKTAIALPAIHPGEILSEEFLVPLGMSARALAAEINVTPARVSEIIAGRRGITADTALRLGRYFGTTPQLWLNLQTQYDLLTVSVELADVIDHISPRAA